MKNALVDCTTITLAVILCLSAGTLRASTSHFAFSGVEGGLFGEPTGSNLAGEFDLDQNATRVDTTWGLNGEGISSVYSSPFHQLSGTFGDWTFSGVADVYVSDGPEFWSDGQENVAPDYWIVRVAVDGPAVNGLTPGQLNLFYYTPAASLVGPYLLPPHDPLSSVNPEDFQFALSFNDSEGPASFVRGRLLTLQSVPEPSTALLLGMALALAPLQRKSRR